MVKKFSDLQVHSNYGGVRYVKTQSSLYPIYYAGDDMFRPLWAIIRSQKVHNEVNYTVCEHRLWYIS